VGLKHEDLDEVTRGYMLEEITYDLERDKIYYSTYLTQSGQGNWLDYLREAAEQGNDDTLAAVMIRNRSFNAKTLRKHSSGKMITAKVPYNAAEVLAEGEFNRFYVRGLSRRALDQNIPRLQVYRAKAVLQPRPESERLIGLLCDPSVLLTDVRASVGVDTALGIPPGPGSGISVRIPKS
jgi:hypothetical protein